jgi:hypothetical protein
MMVKAAAGVEALPSVCDGAQPGCCLCAILCAHFEITTMCQAFQQQQQQQQQQKICRLAVGFHTTVAALNIEPNCNTYCLFSLSLRFWWVQYIGRMSQKPPTAFNSLLQ